MSCRHEKARLSCEEIFARLSEYLDGELDVTICTQLEGHMDDCEPCQRFLASLKSTVDLLHAEPARKMPEGLREQVCQAYRTFCDETGKP